MTRRRSPFIAILLLGICVFQLGLGGSGVFCVAGTRHQAAADVQGEHGDMPAETQMPGMPCHGGGPSQDTRSHQTPSHAPDHSGMCQPMAACAMGFIPAVVTAVPAALAARPAEAILMPIQILASLTFPPEPPPPRA